MEEGKRRRVTIGKERRRINGKEGIWREERGGRMRMSGEKSRRE